MRRPPKPPPSQRIVFTRADPATLAAFDPSTKRCTMNCGPHIDDPRSREERLYLCDDCVTLAPALRPDQLDAIWRKAVAESDTYADYQRVFRAAIDGHNTRNHGLPPSVDVSPAQTAHALPHLTR